VRLFRVAVLALTASACSFSPGTLRHDAATDGAAPDVADRDADLPDTVDVDAAPACEGYTTTATGRYLVVSTLTAWAVARTACETSGGYLVVIADTNENSIVRGLIPSTTRFWLGMSDLDVENTWLWLDNTAVPRAVEYWDGGQPNDSQVNGGEDCGEMSNAGTWNDDNCATLQPYVCECDA
jgi:hypothetical protein